MVMNENKMCVKTYFENGLLAKCLEGQFILREQRLSGRTCFISSSAANLQAVYHILQLPLCSFCVLIPELKSDDSKRQISHLEADD